MSPVAVPAIVQSAGAPVTPGSAVTAPPLTLDCVASAPRRAASHPARAGGSRRAGRSSDAASQAEADTAPRDTSAATITFRFEIDGDRGRVRYPAALTPVVHGGDDGAGWWPIRDLAATDGDIGGRIVLNILNRRRFTIDRRTGAFDLSGGMDAPVTGHCTRVDPGQRLF